jgi:hypothetical protein
MRRERVLCDILINPDEPNVLIIRPKDASFSINSIYEFKLPELDMIDGDTFESQSISYITEISQTYITLDEVMSLAHGLDLKEESVLFHIREACREADYLVKKANKDNRTPIVVTKENIKEDYFPFYMFIKYRALNDCIKEYYIEMVTKPNSIRNEMSDTKTEEKYDLNAVKSLLKDIEYEYAEWSKKVVTITADPKWALRGKFAYPIDYSSTKYHSTNLNGYDRGY